MARKGNRLVYQVEQSLKAINKIGMSKREARAEGEKWIHSESQMKKSLSVCQNFGKWLNKSGVKNLYALKRSHYREYIEHMRGQGVSNGHLINIETNLRLLERGMAVVSAEKGMSPREWTPSERIVKVAEREKPVDRSLSKEQLTEISNKLSDNARIAKTLQEAFGLRVREVAMTTTSYIQEIDGKLCWVASNDPKAENKAKGVTKAGRARIAPCAPSKVAEVRQILSNVPEGSYVVKMRYDSIRNAYKRANVNGSHAFRHTYAREMMREELTKRGYSFDTARETLGKYFDIKDYGNNSKKMAQLKATNEFKQLRECMDQVHKYLGHGEGRMDLARVYISGF